MASVAPHPKSRFWYACYTDRDGKQRKRSTKTTNKRKARRFADEIEAVERKARETQLTNSQLQKVLTEVSERVNGESLDVPTVEDYFHDWLKHAKQRIKPGTYPRYEKSARAFLESLGKKRSLKLTSLTPKHIADFISSRRAEGLAPGTIILDTKAISTALRRAENFGIILKNPVPAANIDLPKPDSSEREVFTSEDVLALVKAAPNVEWQTIIMLSYFAGARLSDCVHMKWENIHPDDGVIIYHQRKTGKKVIVPMHFHIIEHLNHIVRSGATGYLCPTLSAKGPGGKHGLSESFKRIANRAEVDLKPTEGKGIRKFNRRTFHSLRHSFNSALANAGVSEEIRMKLTGHTTRSSHANYTHLEISGLKNAVSTIPLMTPTN